MYATYADHPIALLYKEGISLGVSTDSRMITPITLTQEYEQLHHTFRWNKQQFLQCNLSALQAAFLAEEQKEMLEHRIQKAFASSEDAAS